MSLDPAAGPGLTRPQLTYRLKRNNAPSEE